MALGADLWSGTDSLSSPTWSLPPQAGQARGLFKAGAGARGRCCPAALPLLLCSRWAAGTSTSGCARWWLVTALSSLVSSSASWMGFAPEL